MQKHWRQIGPSKIKNFRISGKNKWTVQRQGDVKKTWSQAVYQVDDSPRYESYGIWVHELAFQDGPVRLQIGHCQEESTVLETIMIC